MYSRWLFNMYWRSLSQFTPTSGSNKKALEQSRAGSGDIDKVKGYVNIVFEFFTEFLKDFLTNLCDIARKQQSFQSG